jgi:hypothetical protein
MDTKMLVVGQNVSMHSGIYDGGDGKVVKVTPEGVDVQTTGHGLLHFDTNGLSYITEITNPSYDPSAHPVSPWRWDGNGTYEEGPWKLEDYISPIGREQCADCRFIRAVHHPNHENYAWCRTNGMCEHFKEPVTPVETK